MLVVAINIAQVATDKQQVEPMLDVLADLPEALVVWNNCWPTTVTSARRMSSIA